MSLSERLRHETKNAHEQVEQAVDLPSRVTDLERYRALLTRYHAFYCMLESEYGTTVLPRPIDPNIAEKIVWLATDIKALDRPCGPKSQSGNVKQQDPGFCRDDGSPYEKLLGYSYVLHGSMLGGRFIAKSIAHSLRLDARTGGRFFAGHGEETGNIWREFRAAIDVEALDEAQQSQVIAHAHECFTRFGKALAA